MQRIQKLLSVVAYALVFIGAADISAAAGSIREPSDRPVGAVNPVYFDAWQSRIYFAKLESILESELIDKHKVTINEIRWPYDPAYYMGYLAQKLTTNETEFYVVVLKIDEKHDVKCNLEIRVFSRSVRVNSCESNSANVNGLFSDMRFSVDRISPDFPLPKSLPKIH